MYLSKDAKAWWRTKYDDIQHKRYTIATWADLKTKMKTIFFPENVAYLACCQLRELKKMSIVY